VRKSAVSFELKGSPHLGNAAGSNTEAAEKDEPVKG
jgi:hypothetical protein